MLLCKAAQGVDAHSNIKIVVFCAYLIFCQVCLCLIIQMMERLVKVFALLWTKEQQVLVHLLPQVTGVSLLSL